MSNQMSTRYSLPVILILVFSIQSVLSLDNGLAKTPPMGWLSWARFECITDCITYPDECINEKLYKDMIDRIVDDGYAKLGYRFVNIDDCWMEHKRDKNTSRLIPDRKRFPNGIKYLSDYAHKKGALLGIYEDVGTLTCGGYPGTQFENVDHTLTDAETFSDWQVDSLKLDGCYQNTEKFNVTYPEYTKALAKQKQPIMYACSWPAYIYNHLDEKSLQEIQENCNYWRNYGDIQDSAGSLFSIIKFYGDNIQKFAKYHGPGGWFDPDMLIIGNDGLSYEQSKTQMAFWCLWSAPLLMSNDLRTIKPEYKEILQNKHLIAVDQDPLGKMGIRVLNINNQEVWKKQLSPENGHDAFVVLYFNKITLGPPRLMSYQLSQIVPELKKNISYDVYDLFDNYAHIGTLKPEQKLNLRVHTSGSVRIVKLVAK